MNGFYPMLVPFARIVLTICLLAGAADISQAENFALTVYGGRVTTEVWERSLSPNVDFADAYILVGALAFTMARFCDNALTLEIEGQAAKYVGDQDHWEFNLPLAGRWQKFPWNDTLETSFAFGLGPSWATEEPEVEKQINASTEQFLVYWFGEISLGPPRAAWAVVLRLHHRSKAFGLVADEGGSNTLAAGLKFRF
jgi:hypothetical protein